MVKLLHVGIEVGKGKWLDKELSQRTDYAEIKCKADDSDIKRLFDYHKPDVVFMQIQREGVVSYNLMEYMAAKSVVINWSGDVREPLPEWYKEAAKYCVPAFSNMPDVEELNGEFLQIGIDPEIYQYRKHCPGADIVFMANRSDCFPLSGYRDEVIEHLKRRFGQRFKLCGSYPNANFNFNSDQYAEAQFYSGSKIAISISHFNRSRYFSDRLIRAMGSGCFTLSHRYESIEVDFKEGEHLETFDSIPDMIEKIEYYLGREDKRFEIARAGMAHVHENFTVKNMVDDILKIYEKHKSIH